MKLGVVIAVSKYAGSGLSDLPGCVQDANLVHMILAAQEEYQDILMLTTNTNSAEIKQRLIEFVNKYKGNAISEFVFYYTGHGAFMNNEYYYLFSDYKPERLRQTALENTELDNLMRSLNPSLATKMVDSCQSGLPYIKDLGEIGLYLKGTQSGFQNCYFLFSSHTDESSYQDNVISAFTRAVGELVASRTGVVRHKDIIDYVSDSFAQNTLQTPFFVVQADFTDQFCKVESTLQKKVADLLTAAAQPSGASVVSLTGRTTLKALVEADAKYYCTREEANAALNQFNDHLIAYGHPAEAMDFYKVEVRQLSGYSEIPDMSAIGKWFNETTHTFFAMPVTRLVGTSFKAIEEQITGVRSTTAMPYVGLLLRATPLYPNLDSAACFLLPFISRTHMLLFAARVSILARDWEDETIAGEINWRPFEVLMKDEAGIVKTISAVMNDFWDVTITSLKKKYGLVKGEIESDTGEKPGKNNTRGQEDASDRE